jgi:hypothetical protein
MNTELQKLTFAEETTLAEFEAIIQRNKWAFMQVCRSLSEIHLRRLYRAEYPTFEAYCKGRWGISRQTAYDYLKAAEVVGNLTTPAAKALPSATGAVENVRTCVQSLPSLSQAREMAVLPPEQQRKVAAATDFASTTVSELKQLISELKANEKADRKAAAPASRVDILPPVAEPGPESGMAMVRVDALCQMCRERLFPSDAPVVELTYVADEDFRQYQVADEPAPEQAMDREYVADDEYPEVESAEAGLAFLLRENGETAPLLEIVL